MKALLKKLMQLLGFYQEEPPEFEPDPESRWLLSYGIHRGDYWSREVKSSYFETEQEARNYYRKARRSAHRLGYIIWFAHLITPEGKQLNIDLGNSYKRPD